MLLAASKENNCRYSTASHSALARFFANVPNDAIVTIESDQHFSDHKLNALVNVTRQLVSQRGYAPRKTIDEFIAAGYSKDQLLEVLVGFGLKTISNYFGHVSAIEIDLIFWETDPSEYAYSAGQRRMQKNLAWTCTVALKNSW